jgi:hypothetical protein
MSYIYTLKEADCESGPFKASIDKESLVQYAKERYGMDLVCVDAGEVVYLKCPKGYFWFEIHKVSLIGPVNIWGDAYG